MIHGAGNYDLGLAPALKWNLLVRYSLGNLDAGLRLRFIGGYEECADAGGFNTTSIGCADQNVDPATRRPYPAHEVSASFTWDLHLAYRLQHALGVTTLSAGVRNLFDQRPPRVYNSALTYADPQYDVAGRAVHFRADHRF